MNSAPPFPPEAQFARAHQNERMISVESISGYRMFLPEDEVVHFFDLNVPDEPFGEALISALSRSRLVDPVKERDFFDHERYGPLVCSRQKKS